MNLVAMTPADWIKRSRDPAVLSSLATDAYSEAYPSILEHFGQLNKITWNDAIVGIHIVYGWMPTIPRLRKTFNAAEDSQKKRAFLEILNRVHQGGDLPKELELETLRTFVNASIVGASKLLHFLDPERSPIWDSRVANAYLKGSPGARSLNDVGLYEHYRDTLIAWTTDQTLAVPMEEVRLTSKSLAEVSKIRLLELVLFHPSPRVA